MEYYAMFFNNGDIYEEFVVDVHYIALLAIFQLQFFLCDFNCYEGYMVFVRAKDEQHPHTNLVGESIIISQFCSN